MSGWANLRRATDHRATVQESSKDLEIDFQLKCGTRSVKNSYFLYLVNQYNYQASKLFYYSRNSYIDTS